MPIPAMLVDDFQVGDAFPLCHADAKPEQLRRRERNPEDVFVTMQHQGICSMLSPRNFSFLPQFWARSGDYVDPITIFLLHGDT
jgi:hypothetical protein